MNRIESVNSENFAQKVLEADQPVLVDFWASWCPPCKMMEPLLATIAGEYSDKAVLVKVNVDQNAQLRDIFSIDGVPTFILFQNGEEITRRVGAQSKAQLEELLKKGLAAE